jgi:hypothetical protein
VVGGIKQFGTDRDNLFHRLQEGAQMKRLVQTAIMFVALYPAASYAGYNAIIDQVNCGGEQIVGAELCLDLTVANLSTPDTTYGGAATFCLTCDIARPGDPQLLHQQANVSFNLGESQTISMPMVLVDVAGDWTYQCRVSDISCGGQFDAFVGDFATVEPPDGWEPPSGEDPPILSDVPPNCPGNCQGVAGYVDHFDYDFGSIKSPNGLWTKQSWTWGCQLDPGMVTTDDGVAVFNVTAGGTHCGQIDSAYGSYFYGRYRTRMMLSAEQGVVNSIFFYGPGGESEIDIEYLSKENEVPQLHLIAHPNNGTPCGGATHKCHKLAFDPAIEYHTYGFDIHPDRVDFFVDEQLVATIYENIPQNPGALIFNNWAIGDWAGPAPQYQNVMYVDWAKYEPFEYCDVCSDCGDGQCTGSESCQSCAADCGSCPAPAPADYCGDGKCDANEDCEYCAADCGSCPPAAPFCGDGQCDAAEDCSSCSADCGACACVPQCDGLQCGDDGCGGSCGSCGSKRKCSAGMCVPPKLQRVQFPSFSRPL